jgi:hypothetical protein
MTKQSAVHARERKLIDQHFSLRSLTRPLGLEVEVELRNHLSGCEACRAYYDRHALLAEVDPAIPPARERLAAALGFAPPPVRHPIGMVRGRLWLAVLPVAAALVLLVVWRRGGDATDSGFVARGARSQPGLYAYRVSRGQSLPLADRMPADEELAFAYENPTGYRWLLVLAVDQAGKQFWYHPDPDAGDRAVPISVQPGRHELPVAVRHPYQGGQLVIMGIFTNRDLSLADVRPVVDSSGCAAVRARLPDVACVQFQVAVAKEAGP